MEQKFGGNSIDLQVLREFCVFSPSALSSGLCRVYINNNYFMRYLMSLFHQNRWKRSGKIIRK